MLPSGSDEERKKHLDELQRQFELGQIIPGVGEGTVNFCPARTIIKDWCPECGGLGHGKKCKCSDGVAFVMGCCETCGGEGMITVEEKPKGIILTDPDWTI